MSNVLGKLGDLRESGLDAWLRGCVVGGSVLRVAQDFKSGSDGGRCFEEITSSHVPDHFLSFQLILENLATLHDELDAFQLGDVGGGISSDGDQIGKLARLD